MYAIFGTASYLPHSLHVHRSFRSTLPYAVTMIVSYFILTSDRRRGLSITLFNCASFAPGPLFLIA